MGEERATVLIEDNEDHALVARWVLARNAAEKNVVWLRDGEEALRCLVDAEAAGAAPHLILLDINLPKVNGIEVLRRIRACPRLRETPVVMLTTSDDQEDMAACFALGADGYLVKPVRFEELSSKLSSIPCAGRDGKQTKL